MERAEPEFERQLQRRSGRQTEAEHLRGHQREHERSSTAERTKRKANDEEEDEEVRRIETVRFGKKIEREEKQNTESEILEVKVNKQLVEMENEEQLDPALVWKR